MNDFRLLFSSSLWLGKAEDAHFQTLLSGNACYIAWLLRRLVVFPISARIEDGGYSQQEQCFG